MKTVIAGLVLIGLCASHAFAAGIAKSCGAELKDYCPSASNFPDRVRCLGQQRDKLSKGCKAAIDRERSEGQAFRSDCSAEIGGSCLDLQGRALMECLEGLGDKLSKSCADHVKSMRSERRARHERIPAACRQDAEKVCGGISAGGIKDCLKAGGDKISQDCRDGLK